MWIELEALHRDLKGTMIYVTHDQVEAMTMADKSVVLKAGRIEQVGSPMDLYHRPETACVAGLIGAPAMNFIDVNVADGQAAGYALVVRADWDSTLDHGATVGLSLPSHRVHFFDAVGRSLRDA